MASSLLLGYSLITLILLGVAIYEHTNAATLSLPLSSASTISTILLPILSFLNTVYYASRPRPAQNSPSRGSRQNLLPPGLQVVQTILTTVLGTTFLSDIVPSSTRQCILSTRWQQLWTAHDATTIRRIQDAFDCCGFNSVKDRAWPFPHKGNPQPDCAAQWSRTGSCAGPWTQALQTSGGIEFGVVATVGVLQLINILLMRYVGSRGRRNVGGVGWMTSTIKRLTGGDEDHGDGSNVNRPLLEGGNGLITHETEDQSNGSRNHGVGGEDRPRQARGANGYGSAGGSYRDHSRVEPSHLEPSPWAGEDETEA